MKLSFDTEFSKVKPLFDYLKKQQDNRKFAKTIEISATFTLITFFMFFAIRPTFNTIAKLKGDIESKKILKNELKNKINNVIMAQDQFSQVQEKYLVINSSLPDRPLYYQAASQIIKTGKDEQNSIENLTFTLDQNKAAKIDGNVREYAVSLSVNGDFNSALSVASKLLKNRRIVNIDSLMFDRGGTDDSATPSATNKINTRFSSTFYYWPTIDEKK